VRELRAAALALLDGDPPKDPYALYRDLHDRAPILWLFPGRLLVSSYDHCRQALGMADLRPRDRIWTQRTSFGGRHGPAGEALLNSLAHSSGTEHRRLRQRFAPYFTPAACGTWQPLVSDLVHRTVDNLGTDGEAFDAVTAIAQPLPMNVIGAILGLPETDRPRISRRTAAFARALEWPGAPDPDADAAAIALLDDLTRLVVHHDRHPGTGLLSRLAPEAADPTDLVADLAFLITAATVTTRDLITSSLATLAAHPQLWSGLRDRPDRVAAYVSEILRTSPPVRVTSRHAPCPTRIGETDIPADTLVLIMIEAAHHDARRFPDPDRFDPDRFGQAAPALLAFGAGPHYCLGAALGRLTGETLLCALAARHGRLTPAGDAVRRAGSALAGHRTLPLRLEPGTG